MEGGHQPRLLSRRQHGTREQGRSGVWHGIMHVQDIQPMLSADFGHLDRKRQGVIRVFEKSVIVDADGVKIEPWSVCLQSKGAFVADEVHLVTAARQVFSQGRGENATRSERGITDRKSDV